jgi:acetoin utilization protein AcuB
MLMPVVSRYMTREPYRIASTSPVEEARAMMAMHGIRHLPVMEGDKLLGIVSQSDVRLVEAVPGIDLGSVEVARIVTSPICVWGETSLDEVAETMAANKADCVVVLGGHGVQGVFTSSDALRALGEILQRVTA